MFRPSCGPDSISAPRCAATQVCLRAVALRAARGVSTSASASGYCGMRERRGHRRTRPISCVGGLCRRRATRAGGGAAGHGDAPQAPPRGRRRRRAGFWRRRDLARDTPHARGLRARRNACRRHGRQSTHRALRASRAAHPQRSARLISMASNGSMRAMSSSLHVPSSGQLCSWRRLATRVRASVSTIHIHETPARA